MVFINGANIGRYWNRGPPRTLYVPAPILSNGINKVSGYDRNEDENVCGRGRTGGSEEEEEEEEEERECDIS